jgi:hypothetical protein
MNTLDEAWWTRARQARDQLAAQLSGNTNVSLIDIGLDPSGVSNTPVLRVHVREIDPSGTSLPDSIAGIPVRVTRGDYKLQ